MRLALHITFLLTFASAVLAQETITIERNAAVNIDFTLRSSADDAFVTGETFATDDCQLIEEGGSLTNCSAKVSTRGSGYRLALVAGDIDTTNTIVYIEDQSTGSEAWIPISLRLLTAPSSVSDTSAFYSASDVNVMQIEDTDATDQLDTSAETGADASLATYDAPTKAELDSGLAALNDLSASAVRTAVGLASADLDTQLTAIDTVVDAIKVVTDVLDGLIENSSGNRFTEKALEEAPSGGSSLTCDEFASCDPGTYFGDVLRQRRD